MTFRLNWSNSMSDFYPDQLWIVWENKQSRFCFQLTLWPSTKGKDIKSGRSSWYEKNEYDALEFVSKINYCFYKMNRCLAGQTHMMK